MNLFSSAIAGFFAILAVIFLVLLVVAIARNLEMGRRYRRRIAGQLSKLRLFRMLGIHDIDPETYLHAQSVLDIRSQMKHCAECASTRQCDTLLEEGVGDPSGFCENDAALRKVGEAGDS